MKADTPRGAATPVDSPAYALDMAKAIAAPPPMIYIMLDWPSDHLKVVWAEDPVDRRLHYAASVATWARLSDTLMLEQNREIEGDMNVVRVSGPTVTILMLDRWTTEVLGADPPDTDRPIYPHTLELAPDGPHW